MNLDKLIKIMRLSTSESDGEALSALRKANSMLKEANLDWNDLLSKYEVRPESSYRRPQKRPKEEPYTRTTPEEAREKAARAADNLRRASKGFNPFSSYDPFEDMFHQENKATFERAAKEAEREFQEKMREADPKTRLHKLCLDPLFQQMIREKQDAFILQVISGFDGTGIVQEWQVKIVESIFMGWKREQRK